MKKKISTILLALVMMLNLVPTTALAEEAPAVKTPTIETKTVETSIDKAKTVETPTDNTETVKTPTDKVKIVEAPKAKTSTVENKEITIMQSLVNIKPLEGGDGLESTSVHPWQFELSETNPTYTVYTDEKMKDESLYAFVFRDTEYTYYGYSIRYTDNTRVMFKDRTLNYETLKKQAEKDNKKISYVNVYYGPKSLITVNYNLVKKDGTKELLKTTKSYGRFDTKYNDWQNNKWEPCFDVKGEVLELNPLVNKYVIVKTDKEAPFKYLEKDEVINVDLRLPNITVKFQDKEGKKLKDDVGYDGEVGKTLKIEEAKIPGYKFTKNVSLDTVFKNKDSVITLVYDKDGTKPTDPTKSTDPTKPTNETGGKNLPKAGTQKVIGFTIGGVALVVLGVFLFKGKKKDK